MTQVHRHDLIVTRQRPGYRITDLDGNAVVVTPESEISKSGDQMFLFRFSSKLSRTLLDNNDFKALYGKGEDKSAGFKLKENCLYVRLKSHQCSGEALIQMLRKIAATVFRHN